MTIGLIGAGNMARALARGWNEPVFVSDAGSGRAAALAADVGGNVLPTEEVADLAELVVLCHKPAQLESVAARIAPHARAVISVLGGVGLERLRAAYPGTSVAWAMPNTAVEVLSGLTCLCEDPDGDPGLHAKAAELFGRLGEVVRIPETLMGVATALTGVGPAYTALLVEAQVDAAVRRGMGAPLAGELVCASLAGSARLIAERQGDTLGVRRAVTSPGGMTARGLAALERGGVRAAFEDAMEAVLGGGAR
jgi:pyrroline-5-carboxylate reductase